MDTEKEFASCIKVIFEQHPELGPSNIWNCDESGFPTDPSKVKVKGQKALKLRFGLVEKIYITILAVYSAAVVALDLFKI